jgi:hypothetical protein
MSDKREVFNECYLCEKMFKDILDLINHIKLILRSWLNNKFKIIIE